jgi:hypothetical protein
MLLHVGHACPFTLSKHETRVDLSFSDRSAELTQEARNTLRQVVDDLNHRDTEVILLFGHADASEPGAKALGLARAGAVEQHLWQLGVNPSRTYIESVGSTQPRDPGQPASNRRVELEEVSLPLGAAPSLAGLSLMNRWVADAASRKPYLGDPGRIVQPPDAFLPQVEPALRPRFLRLMQLVAIKDRQDSRLAALRALDDGRLPDGDPLPPALYAQVFGSPYASAVTRREAGRVSANDPRRMALAQRLWCDSDQSQRPAIERVRTALPTPTVLQALPEAAQFTWVTCALHSADALRWLRQQGVSLDAKRQPDGWTALHTAINDADNTAFTALMAAGADPRATNHAGETPLHRVAHPDGHLLPYASQKLFWEQLLQAGADRDALDQRGQPARLHSQPLPPRNVHIADTWPPQWKRRVDALLALFSSRSTAPSAEEIAARLGVELQDLPTGDQARSYAKIYAVRASGTPAGKPPTYHLNPWDYGPFYFISTPSAKGAQMHTFTMTVADAGFCLNPYELAIYTGASFSGGMHIPSYSGNRSAPKPWHNAYARDMFKSSPVNTYRAESFHITTLPVRDPRTHKVTDEGCVQTMGVTADFPH